MDNKIYSALVSFLNEAKSRSSRGSVSYQFEIKETVKYFKVTRKMVHNGHIDESGSAYAFIDKVSGDILKAASWKAPAKHARGNVLSVQNGTEALTIDGFIRYL